MGRFLGLIELGVAVRVGAFAGKIALGNYERGFPHPTLAAVVLGIYAALSAVDGFRRIRES